MYHPRVWWYRYREAPVLVLLEKYASTGTGTGENKVPFFLPVPVPIKIWYHFFPGTGTVQSKVPNFLPVPVPFKLWYRLFSHIGNVKIMVPILLSALVLLNLINIYGVFIPKSMFLDISYSKFSEMEEVPVLVPVKCVNPDKYRYRYH